MADLLPRQATSAIMVALAFAPGQAARLRIPRGFGFVVPQVPGEEQSLLACTFVDQKFAGRVPPGHSYCGLSSAVTRAKRCLVSPTITSLNAPDCNWAAFWARCRKLRKR